MPTVVPVKFAFANHDLWFDPQETGAKASDHVICSTERGTEIGLVTMDPFEAPEEELDGRELKPVLRVATEDDLERAQECVKAAEEAFPVFRRLVEESELEMKPVGVEYLFGGEKLVCYFAAEDRIDFRQLVRDLGRELHERIDMRQIGVREEAAFVGGFAHCGQELCCTRFGRQFEPVSIRMAKEQDLPLNSAKISGACGRLMCCLRYEFEAYRDFKNRAPKRNAVIDTPLGKAKIVEYDTPKEELGLRLENGKTIYVPLSEMEASPEACKKSEELGCVLRPDMVSRAALERLNSAEVQMALAEIDREFSDTDELYDDADLFTVSSYGEEPTKLRTARRQQTESAAETSQDRQSHSRKRERDTSGARRRMRKHELAGNEEEPQETTTRTRRRRHHTTEEPLSSAAHEASSQLAAAQSAPEQSNKRRTRRPGDKRGMVRTQPEETNTQNAQESTPTTRRRRRHHTESGE